MSEATVTEFHGRTVGYGLRPAPLALGVRARWAADGLITHRPHRRYRTPARASRSSVISAAIRGLRAMGVDGSSPAE
ncbi:hypothetical protein JWS13_02785 (plasmid) [Rhodococcus pseudokoreensis]|uniref:Uncharacterized protein n=1 Tax=Rhodococcus pseudokoreensis TaxID=2811421 RepID=A0A974VXU5_9NOCA|nr:hypothetical protein [Rhodococcus pseudokoreensis]QSE87608.1 hypothetical protein JWS13_02785 [Rhodococcus pseudokoreensis]